MRGWLLAAALAVVLPDGTAAQPMPGMALPTQPGEKTFLEESQAAMDRMMAGMAAKPTGNIDKDFVAMMAPHHQGAIDMAKAYLKAGANPALRRLAQDIVQNQQREITLMQRAVR